MKKLIFLAFSVLLITACSEEKLDKQKAFQLIAQSQQYPKLIAYTINTADPNQVSKLINSEPIRAGLIAIEEPHSLGDIGSTLITFTEKADPYLIPITSQDSSSGVRRIKIAQEELSEVSDIELLNEGKNAVARYQTVYKNISPFSVLIPVNFKKEISHKAYFLLKDNHWQLEETGL
ncbi:hypothetical protein [Arcticibacter tournemirensis]